MKFQLEVAGMKRAIDPEKPLLVGRTRGDFLFPGDDSMSGLHFEIRVRGEQIAIQNHSKTNGTKVNGTSIEMMLLQPGDVIQAGSTTFILTVEEKDPLHIQNWRFHELPSGWQISPEQGLWCSSAKGNLATVFTSEDKLPEGYDLKQYLDIQLLLISERLPAAKADLKPMNISGAESSAYLSVRTSLPDGRVALQQQLYATVTTKVAIVTATMMENETPDVLKTAGQLMDSVTFVPISVGNS